MKSLIAALCFFSLSAHAAYIVDTGPSAARYDAYAFSDWQYFGAQFTLTSTHRIHSLETVVQSNGPATVLYGINSDTNNRPGAPLLTGTTVFAASNSYIWVGAYGLDVELTAGTYWVTFQPAVSITAAISGRATNPLAEYMQGMHGYWHNVPLNNYDSLKLEVRIEGEPVQTSHVPEPGTGLLVGVAGLALVWSRRQAPCRDIPRKAFARA